MCTAPRPGPVSLSLNKQNTNTSAFTEMDRLQGILNVVKMQHKMFNEEGAGGNSAFEFWKFFPK